MTGGATPCRYSFAVFRSVVYSRAPTNEPEARGRMTIHGPTRMHLAVHTQESISGERRLERLT